MTSKVVEGHSPEDPNGGKMAWGGARGAAGGLSWHRGPAKAKAMGW